jgi:putative thioredoxin
MRDNGAMTTQPNPNLLRGAVDLAAVAAARQAQEQAAARKDDPAASRVIIDVTEASFEADVIGMSQTVPVVVDLWASWCGPCKQLSPVLEKLAVEYAGRWILAKVDVDAEQQIAAAFRVQSIPTVVAVIGGQVLPLFQGALPEPQVRQYLEELLRVAGEAGISGSVGAAPASEPAVEEDSRWDRAADAVEAGEWDLAISLYEQLKEVDAEQAQAAIAQVSLVRRTEGVDPVSALAEADADPMDLAKAKRAADLEVASGAPESAFERLLAVVRASSGEEKAAAKDAVLDLFALVGDGDPAVVAARTKLANALF